MHSIKEIAKRANVSISSVSNALNNKKNISAEVKERIIKIADEMGYVPNSSAIDLLKKRTNVIGFIVEDLSNHFSLNVFRHIETFAVKEGFYLLVGCVENSIDSYKATIDRFVRKKIDAFVVIPGPRLSREDILEIVSLSEKYQTPVIFFNFHFTDIDTNIVTTDIEDGFYKMTKHFLKKGKKRLLYIGGNLNINDTHTRMAGFKKAHKEFGIKLTKNHFLFSDVDEEFKGGYQAMKIFLKSKKKLPDAFIALNDIVALGAHKCLKEYGYSVPEDVDISGSDNVELIGVDTFPPTTLSLPMEEMCYLTMGIIKKCQKQKNVKEQYRLPHQIIERPS